MVAFKIVTGCVPVRQVCLSGPGGRVSPASPLAILTSALGSAWSVTGISSSMVSSVRLSLVASIKPLMFAYRSASALGPVLMKWMDLVSPVGVQKSLIT